MTLISTLDEMAKHFGRTRNACTYQIKLGRLPDPRTTPIDSTLASWPKGNKRGRKLGPSNARRQLVESISALTERVAQLESRLTFQETLGHTHE